MGPVEEGYALEKKWFQACEASHDLWCLCGNFRQHFQPGCGVITPAGDDSVADADMADIIINFDVGEPTGDATGDAPAAATG